MSRENSDNDSSDELNNEFDDFFDHGHDYNPWDYDDGTHHYNPLLLAVHNGDLNSVRCLFDKHPDNEKEFNGRTVMHIAAAGGHDHIVSFLCQRNSPFIKEDPVQMTPLHLAIKYNHLKVFKLLLNEKTMNQHNPLNNETPLHLAARRDEPQFVEMLLKLGANPNIVDEDGMTPLDRALDTASPNMKIVTLLMEHGASLEQNDNERRCPLMSATLSGYPEVVKFLLKNKVHFKNKIDKETPLHIAAQFGEIEVAKILVKNGYDTISTEIQNCPSPLYLAATKGHIEIVKYFTETGLKALESEELLYDSLRASFRRQEIWNYLSKNGSIFNRRLFSSQTELHFAVRAGNVDAVKKILNRESREVEFDSTASKLAVLIAVENENEEILKILLEAGCSFESCVDNTSPLHVAATFDHTRLVEKLLEAGADLNSKTKFGETVLHFAAASRQLSTVKFLLEAGIEPTAITSTGHTALYYALIRGWYREPVSPLMFDNLLKITEMLVVRGIYEIMKDHDFIDVFDCASGILITTEVEDDDFSTFLFEEREEDKTSILSFQWEECNRKGDFSPEIVKCLLHYLKDDKIKTYFKSIVANAISLKIPALIDLLLEYDITNNNNTDFLKFSFILDNYRSNLLLIDHIVNTDVLLNLKFVFSTNVSTCTTNLTKDDVTFQMVVARIVLLTWSDASSDFDFDNMNYFGENDNFLVWGIECQKQIVEMEETKVHDEFDITYCDILLKPADKIANYVRCKKLMKKFQSSYVKFSMYAEFLERNVEKAKQRRKLIDTSADCLFNCVKRKYKILLPILAIRNILDNLSVVDLRRFLAANS